ncbi:NACHT domain-containing protein [Streptomyces sp. NPDC050439]|uniref:NACHT domain-containing protein n=1 Tax=unclassified Streptomyces TaxID=2593676 RepID=UPI00343ABE7E
MDPAAIGSVSRLASSVVTPLVKRLFVREGPGAGLVEKPVRLSGLVSFRGEKRKLTDKDLAKLAAELVRQAVRASGESAVPADEEQAVVDALARTLHALGDLTLTDVQAVELGHNALALRLRRASGNPDRDLSADAAYFYDRLLDTTCLHILHFFTQRSAFVARTLVEQSRRQSELITKIDELIARNPLPGAEDVAFEQRYLAYVARKHGKLTIFGIDLTRTPGKWPLDAAYMSLEATDRTQTYAMSGEVRRDPWGTPIAPTPRPADQSLAEHDRVLLRGEAGSGKTTLVQWLAVSAASPAPDDDRMTYLYDRIPYVLPLRTLTRHGERLPAPADFLAAVGSPLAGTQPKGWESRVLTAGRALILVDGIDEIPESERARTREWLTDLIDAHPGNRWLVTSRPSAVREDWLAEEGFAELTLSPMGGREVAAFISRWHTAAATGVPEEDDALVSYEAQLLQAVSAKPDLGLLATNPLMCGLICALHRDRRGFLPLSRKDLYTAALSMLLVRRDRERDMGIPEVREEPQLQLLQRLAYWLIRNGRTEMDRSRAEAVIADALPSVPELTDLGDAQAVYAHFLHRSGLLREPAPGTVDFIHRTFQDFLGARAVVDEGDFGLLVRQATDDQWADVIRMAVAQARPRERAEIFRDLIESGDAQADARTRNKIHLTAAACLEHAAELAPDVRREVERRMAALIPPRGTNEARELAAIGPMVLDLLPGPDDLSRDEARHVAVTATHVASDAAIPFLARLARHPSLRVRSQLMWGWGRYEARPYAEQVIAQLDDGTTHFSLQSDAQVRELERLGLRPKHLDIRASVSPEAASGLIAACVPTSLALELPPDRLTPEALHGLRRLDSLRFHKLSLDSEWWNLAYIPAEAPLRTLGFVGSWDTLGDAHRMRRWRELTWLIFGDDDGPSAAGDWQYLEDLPRLERLSVTPSILAHATPPLRLATVDELILTSTNGWQDATSHLAEIFPTVTRLQVVTRPGEETLDLGAAPLPPTLRLVMVPDIQVTGLDAIPSGVEVDVYPALTD